MLVGAVLSALGFASITQGNLVLAYLGFAVCGGIGAGLVYATCINLVGKWYPERRGGKTGFVNGGFAYGAVPFIFIFSYALHPNTYVWVLDLVAVYMLVVVAACGWLFRIRRRTGGPRMSTRVKWANSKSGAESLKKNPPAVRQYTPMEAIKTGMLPLDVAVAGHQRRRLAVRHQLHGAVRQGPRVRAADRGVVRRCALDHQRHRPHGDRLAYRTGSAASRPCWSCCWYRRCHLVGLLYAGKAHNEIGFLCFAFLVGFGGGAFYPMFASLTPDYFGENNNASNYGLIYSSKLLGSVVGYRRGRQRHRRLGLHRCLLACCGECSGIGRDRGPVPAAGPPGARGTRPVHPAEEVARHPRWPTERASCGRPRESGQAVPSAAFWRRCSW